MFRKIEAVMDWFARSHSGQAPASIAQIATPIGRIIEPLEGPAGGPLRAGRHAQSTQN